jgi:tetratricopeptide (TPR) repeat protein
MRFLEAARPLPSKPTAAHFALRGRVTLDRSDTDRLGVAQARALFERALTLDPNHVHALHGIARVATMELSNLWSAEPQRLLAETLPKIDRAVRLTAGDRAANHDPLRARGSIHRLRGDWPGAIADFEALLSWDLDYAAAAQAHGELGRVLVETRHRDAERHLLRALALSPEDPQVYYWHYWLGIDATLSRRYSAAQSYFSKAQAIRPQARYPRIWLGIIAAGMGEPDMAREHIVRATSDGPLSTVSNWFAFNTRRLASLEPIYAPLVPILRDLGLPE